MNTDKDFIKLNELFNKDTWVIDDSFLKEDTCRILYNCLNNLDPSWWYHSSVTNEGKKEIRYRSEGYKMIEKRREEALQLFSTSTGYSYSFDRTVGDHYLNCSCEICNFEKNIIQSQKFLDYIKTISGFDDIKLGTFFFTRYKGGDFLYPHTDSPNGKIAVVLHITKNWKPWYGGNLLILDKNWENIRKTFTPKYNSMIIMNIEGSINPHLVSFIPEEVKEFRYSMVCWFN
tara:strand:+ start:3118 stop:3810 length:693 start_codon:yes stop_codon:yes gene_type:complete